MRPVTIIQSNAVPLNRSDIDTDQIIPSDWLKRIERTGFEKGLFSEWRDDPAFALNDERYSGAKILLAGPNFGTGSSREHAVWALQQYGFEAVISSKFGDIFKNNCTKCGLVPVEISSQAAQDLFEAVEKDSNLQLSIDIEKLTLEAAAKPVLSFTFHLEPSTQERFLKGLDDISLSLNYISDIGAYEDKRPRWLTKL